MTVPVPRRPVTVVVPIYDDLPGLERCIVALRDGVNFDVDRVLLSNDAGPNADAIERRVLELIDGHTGFQYTRNERNLGFVGNCNRAVLEIDTSGNDVLLLNSDTVPPPGFVEEMAAVLASDDMIGVVCARSDNATIASLPFSRRNPSARATPERTKEVHAAVRDLLPRSTVAPVAMGFCFLTRRSLIERFGLFDEVYSPGYGEENDYCLRINEHGYVSVFANRALVLHAGSTSFSGDRGPTLRLAHERILLERYPFYGGALALFQSRFRDAVDVFADTFVPNDGVVRVALHLPTVVDSATVDRVGALLAAAPDDVVITLVVTRQQLRAARGVFPDARIAAGSRSRQVYDVAVAIGPVSMFDSLTALNASAPRWVLVDAIAPMNRWAMAVAHHRSTALDRIIRRYEDRAVPWRGPEDVLAIVRSAAAEPIDPDRLRARWTAVTDIAEATGLMVHSASVSMRRLAALAFGARNPRLTARLRAIAGRGV
uniref:Glycosyltransferase family 2 protein n=1 Tax=Neobacillus citreus TaxID=2833578 RepID=A0A942T1T5_9BACI